VVIMVVVLFYRQGIMGDKELSVQRMAAALKRRQGFISRDKKKKEGRG